MELIFCVWIELAWVVHLDFREPFTLFEVRQQKGQCGGVTCWNFGDELRGKLRAGLFIRRRYGRHHLDRRLSA